jgi:hypothetical protein
MSSAAFETEERYAVIQKLDMTRIQHQPGEVAYRVVVYNKANDVEWKMVLSEEALRMVMDLGRTALNDELFKNEQYDS